MSDPTPEIIKDALGLALKLFRANPDWDLLRALAEATTTAQCQGVEGFKVFRDVRKAVEDVAPAPLPQFASTASRQKVQDVIEQARLVVGS